MSMTTIAMSSQFDKAKHETTATKGEKRTLNIDQQQLTYNKVVKFCQHGSFVCESLLVKFSCSRFLSLFGQNLLFCSFIVTQ